MTQQKSTFGLVAFILTIICGTLSLVHLYAGPFEPVPTFEERVTQKTKEISHRLSNFFTGKKTPQEKPQSWSKDKIINLITYVLMGISFLCALISFLRYESRRYSAVSIILLITLVITQFIADFPQ